MVFSIVSYERIVHCATRENKCFSRVAHDFFSTIGSESGFISPHGAIKSTLWPASRKKTLFIMKKIQNLRKIILLIKFL